MIKFGTDGWRGVIAEDFTFENLRKVALATANYINSTNKNTPSGVIGYDTRFLSGQFALEVARVLAETGIKVILSDKYCSTPQVSFATKQYNVSLGIIITASHNPAIYNGYKIKANFGGPAVPETISAVESELAKIWDNTPDMNLKSKDEYVKSGMINSVDIRAPFINYLKDKINLNLISKAGFKILYDPMHGAGIHTMSGLLPGTEELHGEYNPGFGNLDHPEPIAECLEELMTKVRDGAYDIGIATDGDADRLGLVDNEGNFVDSHRIFMILLKYLYENKGKRGAVAKTVSLTTMVNLYCEKKGIKLYETPVGFKHIAKLMNETDIIIGGEESGGLSTILHIPERDGLFNSLMILEIMAERGKSLKELCNELDEEFGPHRYARRDVHVTLEQKEQILNAAKNAPAKLGAYDITSTSTTDGFKFFVENGWLLIRASGTEPLIRFYAEAENLDKVNELLDAGQNLK